MQIVGFLMRRLIFSVLKIFYLLALAAILITLLPNIVNQSTNSCTKHAPNSCDAIIRIDYLLAVKLRISSGLTFDIFDILLSDVGTWFVHK